MLPLIGLWLVPIVLFVALVPLASGAESRALSPAPVETVVVGSRLDAAKQPVDLHVTAPAPAQVKSAAAGLVTRVFVTAAAPLTTDSSFNSTFAAAVSRLQKRSGVASDGVFHVSLVAWVPTGTTVAGAVKARVGDSVASGDVLVEGTRSPTAIAFTVTGSMGERPIMPVGPLQLSAGTGTVPLASQNLSAAELATVATFLAMQLAAGTLTTSPESGGAGVTTTYAGALLSTAAPDTVGVVPSSAIHTAAGGSCVFVRTDGRVRAVPLESPHLLVGELGSVSITADLIGTRVVRNPSSLPTGLQASCT